VGTGSQRVRPSQTNSNPECVPRPVTEDIDFGLVAAVVVGVLLVAVTALVGDVMGLTGPAAFVAPLLVGVVIAVGIRIGYA
jgi:hypothetical protein